MVQGNQGKPASHRHPSPAPVARPARAYAGAGDEYATTDVAQTVVEGEDQRGAGQRAVAAVDQEVLRP
ncbi:hypothetical protein ATKI12_3053 [Kitasatospora sp. Ki12]